MQDPAGYQSETRDLQYSDDAGQQKRTKNDARSLYKLFDNLKIKRNYKPNYEPNDVPNGY